MMKWIAVYLLFINIATLVAFGVDKEAAVQGKRRISVSTLLGLAAIGGSAGALIGMHVFHHKTQKKYFSVGVPLILIAQIALLVYLFFARGGSV